PLGRVHSQPSLVSRLFFIIFIVTGIVGIALSYVRINEKRANLLQAIDSLENAIAITNKELNNLRVTAECHKGRCILLQAQAMGLQPPELGQVIRLRRSEPSAGNPREQETSIARLDRRARRTGTTP
ncbi:MAG TPA: hypothetical protein PLE92_10275, partial [Lentisphaeria bacterium]|nr:hypothetical protein [Lentisphaeria bacterium]